MQDPSSPKWQWQKSIASKEKKKQDKFIYCVQARLQALPAQEISAGEHIFCLFSKCQQTSLPSTLSQIKLKAAQSAILPFYFA